jgi:hypothetical protein
MPRGRARAAYVADDGLAYWVWVDRDALADPNRGWAEVTPGSLTVLGRGVLPRRIVGVGQDGRSVFTRVGTTAAFLWTGAATSWAFEGTDGEVYTAFRIGRQEERHVS